MLSQKQILWILLASILLNAFPVFLLPTLGLTDAGAHVYNSSLLLRFIEGEAGFLTAFLETNDWYIPNWSSHLVLAGFLKVGLSPLWAQKLFILIYVLGLPTSCIYFLKKLKGRWQLSFLLALPLVYTYVFMLGFFNFMLGMVFITLGSFIHLRLDNTSYLKYFLFHLVWLGVLYFTHIFVFGIGLLFFLILSVRSRLGLISSVLIIGLSSLPYLILGTSFLFRNSRINTQAYSIELKWLMRDLFTAAPLQGNSQGVFLWFGLSISILVLLLLVYGFYKKVYQLREWPLLAMAMVMLLAYFILPDSSAGGGYISERFLTLFWLFLLLYLGTVSWSKGLQAGMAAFVLILIGFKATSLYREQSTYSKHILQLVDVSETIPHNSLIFIKHGNSKVQLKHAHGYLGVSTNCLLSQNYEAFTDYFPLQWRIESIAYKQLVETEKQADYEQLNYSSTSRIKHYFIWSENLEKEATPYSPIMDDRMLYKVSR